MYTFEIKVYQKLDGYVYEHTMFTFEMKVYQKLDRELEPMTWKKKSLNCFQRPKAHFFIDHIHTRLTFGILSVRKSDFCYTFDMKVYQKLDRDVLSVTSKK